MNGGNKCQCLLVVLCVNLEIYQNFIKSELKTNVQTALYLNTNREAL